MITATTSLRCHVIILDPVPQAARPSVRLTAPLSLLDRFPDNERLTAFWPQHSSTRLFLTNNTTIFSHT